MIQISLQIEKEKVQASVKLHKYSNLEIALAVTELEQRKLELMSKIKRNIAERKVKP